jgi:hypothetical protein
MRSFSLLLRFMPLALLLIFSLPSAGTTRRFDFNDRCVTAYRHVLNLEFAHAARILEEEKKISPDNAAAAYVESRAGFLRAFISEEDNDYNRFKSAFTRHMEIMDGLPDSEPWKATARGEMMLQFAIVRLKRKEYLSAGLYIRKSFRLMDEQERKFPGFVPALKISGLLHAAIGAVPENYKWLSNLAGMHGTIAGGVHELERAARGAGGKWDFLSTEICFLRVFIASHLEKNPQKASEILESIPIAERQKNPLLVFLSANTQLANRAYEAALKTLQSFRLPGNAYTLSYLSYLEGLLMLQRLDQGSEPMFLDYVTRYKGDSFIKSAWQKLGWIRLLGNDTEGYREMMNRVKTTGTDFTDEDKQALKEAETNEIPNVYLLRARLLFDGGAHQRALAELAGKPPGSFPTLKDQLEFTYRLARIFDAQNQPEKAIEYYTLTYENGKSQKWYFAANSALHLGMLYEDQKEFGKAAEWYKKCLALRDHEYQNSIDQKAEAGKNRTIYD